jgi:murein DD-endopeptidase MepM/ murein hydrolase activator NlpD
VRLRALIAALVLALLAGGVAVTVVRCEHQPPVIHAPSALIVGKEARPLVLEIDDEGSGLRQVRAILVTEKGEQPLLERDYPGSALTGGATKPSHERVELSIDAKTLGLREGQAKLRVLARDWSWVRLLQGNETTVELPVTIDFKPPRISLENGQTYLERGGSGLVVYTLSKPSTRDGVEVAGHFYPGRPLGKDPLRRLAFFAIPHDAPPDPSIRVVAEDAAGNRSALGWATHLKERTFPDVTLNLSQQFLSTKVPELAEAKGIDGTDPIAAFQKINSEGRAADEAHVREIVKASADERLWSGAFEQLKNSKVTSQFAEKRSYFVDGKKISQATHFGYDLAVTVASPVTASNSGRVLWADDLGIYGNCVILDHGYGVASLYGHLSRIDVKVGELVRAGQQLGLSGSTGLAGGDHLHFAILVDDTYVDPVEWWDPKWVREKIDSLLAPASGAPPAASAAAPGQ